MAAVVFNANVVAVTTVKYLIYTSRGRCLADLVNALCAREYATETTSKDAGDGYEAS